MSCIKHRLICWGSYRKPRWAQRFIYFVNTSQAGLFNSIYLLYGTKLWILNLIYLHTPESRNDTFEKLPSKDKAVNDLSKLPCNQNTCPSNQYTRYLNKTIWSLECVSGFYFRKQKCVSGFYFRKQTQRECSYM